MKICFVLQRRFAYIGHTMARHIVREHPGTRFCAFVQLRESLRFLKTQQDMRYDSLLLEEDIHERFVSEELDESYLVELEKEYGIPNVWAYLWADRIMMRGQLIREYPHDEPLLSYEDLRKRLQATAKAIIDFLDHEKPDALVVSTLGSVATLLLYHVAKKRGIPTWNIDIVRMGNRVALSEDYRTFTGARARFVEITNGRESPQHDAARAYLEEFRAHPAPYHPQALPTFNKQAYRMGNVQFLAPRTLVRSAWWHLQILSKDITKNRYQDYAEPRAWWIIWDKLKRKTRGLIGFDDLYDAVDLDKRFVYFPLHFEPEIALDLFAPYATNQLELIRAVAHALPIDVLLYVKEHAGMVGYRTRRYYKELKKIPNVRLIDARMRGHTLGQRACLTTTVTGTAGWESLMFKRPVITFGHVFYNDIPGVEYCTALEELPYLIRKQLDEWRHDESTLINYVSALMEESVDVDYTQLWSHGSTDEILTDPGFERLAGALAAKLGLARQKSI